MAQQVTGADGPHFTVTFFGEDVADRIEQGQKNIEMMGEGFQTLVADLQKLQRRGITSNWTPRPDLGFAPSN